MYEELTKLDIPTVVILDSAVGYIMEKVDLVLVGAEGVVESGGIINKVCILVTKANVYIFIHFNSHNCYMLCMG